jgi:hypothetical protein
MTSIQQQEQLYLQKLQLKEMKEKELEMRKENNNMMKTQLGSNYGRS